MKVKKSEEFKEFNLDMQDSFVDLSHSLEIWVSEDYRFALVVCFKVNDEDLEKIDVFYADIRHKTKGEVTVQDVIACLTERQLFAVY